jgi:hypothetical protein
MNLASFPLRSVVRSLCAWAVAIALALDSTPPGLVLVASPAANALHIATLIAGVGLAAFLLWAAWRPGHRWLGLVTGIATLAGWIALSRMAAAVTVEPTLIALVGGSLIGLGSVVVHYQSDPTVLSRAWTSRQSPGG